MGAITDLDCNGHWPGGMNIKQRMQLGRAPPAICCSSVVKVNAISQEWSRKHGMISGVVISDLDMIEEVLLGLIINKTLRLYLPAATLGRQTSKKVEELGNLAVPAGTQLSIPLTVVHQNTDRCGDDANSSSP
ncbi:hypothetical protein NC653_018582 [Populus alba x Populus x berolinensis]|uniref:Uncharacterized protein n=1 Tax=Populus alba x Populus x berolinensis TaxID=444605 RepID=A0AAD6QGU5_9ROSI|nr:hypothetical protein NC653_018582 [Populus alba x Populus x berolinensis]